MAFLVLAATNGGRIEPNLLREGLGVFPIEWFDAQDQSQGGAICLSPLAVTARLECGDRLDCLFVGRVRLDRREELRAKLAGKLIGDLGHASDADLCLQAYRKWGKGMVEQIHGDFAFVIHDTAARELLCVRDRLGVRMLAWFQNGNACWIAGSMRDLVAAPGFDARELDPIWISDFLRTGLCDDTVRSVYSAIRRLPPAHLLSIGPQGFVTQRYWSLEVESPLHLKSPAAYVEEFHSRLDAAMLDRLPRDRVGVMMSGGLDSSTLAAKSVQLGGSELTVFTRTWLLGGQSDPEAQASKRVAEFLGVRQTMVDADRLRFNPDWMKGPAATPEPNFAVIDSPSQLDEAKAMRSEADCWLYGEGPDNALTFEWQMHLRWLFHHRQWSGLPRVLARYLASKSLADWGTTFLSRLKRHGHRQEGVALAPEWVRCAGSHAENHPVGDWRPRAHRNLTSAMWPSFFETLDGEYAPLGIDWRHPFMDLRVLEFLLAAPPIPWGRGKLLIRRAMRGQLPAETLRRPKTPLYRDFLNERLRQNLPALPRSGSEVEPFVDIGRLPDDPSAYPDVYALTRVAILEHWLKTHHG